MTTIFTKQDREAAAKAICDEQKPAPWTKGPLFPCEDCERIANVALNVAMASVQARGATTQGRHEASGDGFSVVFSIYSTDFWKGEFDFALIRLDKED